jgi:hypothetical protein
MNGHYEANPITLKTSRMQIVSYRASFYVHVFFKKLYFNFLRRRGSKANKKENSINTQLSAKLNDDLFSALEAKT